jgi:hypothetical protein
MEILLLPVFIILCGLAGLIHRVCPKGTEYGAYSLLALGVLVVGFIFLGPKNYMLHIPESLQTILHPWILGLLSLVFLALGVTGLIGSMADRFLSIDKNER